MNPQLIATMAKSMHKAVVPYGLLDPESLAFLYMNRSLEKVLEQHRIVAGGVPADTLKDMRAALEECSEKQAEVLLDWAASGTRLELVPLWDEEEMVAIQCFALQSNEVMTRQLEQTLNRLPVGIWLAKPNGEIYWVNEANPGYSPETASGAAFDSAAWVDRVHPDDLVACATSFSKAAVKGKVDPFEFRMRVGDGDYRWFYCDGGPIVNDDGTVDRWAGIALDIHDRKDVDERHRREVSDLSAAAQAEAVQSAKTQAELNQVQKMELLGHLAGGVAHDFNNLLFVIQLNADQILRSAADNKIKEFAHQIQRDVSRARRTASELMTFSGRQPKAPHTYSIKALLEDIDVLLRRAVGAEIDLRIDIPEDLTPVNVDKTYFENVLMNLAVNARDASSAKGVVNIAFRNCSVHYAGAMRDFVQIEVTDTGTGMSEETRARIFEPFFTTKEPGNGTGLGLPMVANFVEQAGGFLQVQSELGRGTSVFLHLPQSVFESPVVIDTPPAITVGGNENLLLVEDDLHVRNALAEALIGMGYLVSTAHSPDIALRYIRLGLTPQLIISDIRMPGRITALEMVHALEAEQRNIPVLFMTGYAPGVGIEEGLVEGRYPILYKPISIEELQTKMREVLSAKG